MRSRLRAALLCCALLLPALAAHGVEPGQPLAAALEELRGAGLRLIFSSAMVSAELRVTVDPGSGSPEEIARRILAPHGLSLDPIRPGLFAVVRQRRSPGAPAAGPPPASESEASPLEVVEIYASRYLIEQQSAAALAEIAREDLASLPGLDQDALRVTRFLPGTASNALSARAHVRGGREDELAVYFDGVPLYDPFHFKDAHGLLGMLDPGAISTIDFFSGVFPARFGNRLSGVLDIRPRQWRGQNEHALGFSLLYSHALTQGRLESHPVQWLGVFRRSNVHLFADLANRHDAEPDFLDALGRIEIDTGARSSLALGWLLLDDDVTAMVKSDTEQAEIGHRDATTWLAWRFAPSAAGELHAALSHTDRHGDRTGRLARSGAAFGALRDRRRFDTTTLRLEGTARLSPTLQLSGGTEGYDYSAEYDFASAGQFEPALAAALDRPAAFARDVQLQRSGQAYAAYAGLLFSPWRAVDFDAGLRWDAQRYGRELRDDQLSPRLAMQYRSSPATTLRLSWGRLAQAERPDELQVADGELAYQAVQRATQSVLSIERRLPRSSVLRAEIFEKRIEAPRSVYENLLDPLVLLPELEIDRLAVRPEHSRAYGAELSLRWQAGERWSGWSSYSWSEVTDRFPAGSAPRSWDQRHSISTSLAWTRAPWQLAGNAAWHSGWRRSELSLDEAGELVLSDRNAGTWPDYLSLDLRASWSRPLARGALQIFGEIGNVTGHRNLCCATYRLAEPGDASSLMRETSVWLPRYVLLGVTWELP